MKIKVISEFLNNSLLQWKGINRYHAMHKEEKRILFYAENNDSWIHFQPLIRMLHNIYSKKIIYMTSSISDPVLSLTDDNIEAIYIGNGAVRTHLFTNFNSEIVVMTMPDLQTFHLKRSKSVKKYIYIFHSPVSTHMIYKNKAFDNYDVLFCVGPHHEAEIREREKIYSLPQKEIVHYGYPLIKKLYDFSKIKLMPDANGVKTVLIAPSWGNCCILESIGIQLVGILLDHNYNVTVRPHPQTRKLRPEIINTLQTTFCGDTRVTIETGILSFDSLVESCVLISDWSGIAIEYAFGLKKPVIFIDVPKKVRNPEYLKQSNIPIEILLREEIGHVVSPDQLNLIPSLITEMTDNQQDYSSKAETARKKWLYDHDCTLESGLSYFKSLLE